jgi:NADPH-dependent 2,4-dienoyl-CoA reductase/sulfur reductase-like enzyme
MKVLIIGGDAAGMSAASRVKRHFPQHDVTVLEKTQDVSYSACGMPYNIADPNRAIEDLVVRSAEVFRQKQDINLLTGHIAQRIDRRSRSVSGITADGRRFSFPYDRALIATGASPKIPEKSGFHLPGVKALKSLEDGRRIKAYIASHRVRKVIVIGMGYVALEMIEALRALGIEVEMVKPGTDILPWMDRQLVTVVKNTVLAHGVALHAGYAVNAIQENAGQLSVLCDHGLELRGQMVLVAIGVQPNSQLAAEAGLEIGAGGAIHVDDHLRTSDPHIFAAGDCADVYHLVTGRQTWIPLALLANRAGWLAADNMCGQQKAIKGVVGSAVFRVFDVEVARTGISASEALDVGMSPESVTIKTRSRAHAHPGATDIWVHMVGDSASGRLLGVQMVGREGCAHRIHAPAVALHQQMTVEAYAQLDLAYAPPFGPVWDPTLTAANQLIKKIAK